MMEQNCELDALVEKIRRDRGFDGSQYKSSFLKRRLSVRLRARNIDSYRAYQALLDADSDEYPQLMSTLTINLSYFFRDGEVFLSIRDNILAPLIEQRARANQRHLTIWSAGCAGGEEPYSLAITLWELLGSKLERWRVQILATDIDRDALNQARSGKFTEFSFRGANEQFLAPYFTLQDKFYLIHPELKQLVTFRQQDLMKGDPANSGPFDLILCRNVLIYFSRQQQTRVLTSLYQTLRPGGHLVLGKTEIPLTCPAISARTIDPRLHIYAKSVKQKK